MNESMPLSESSLINSSQTVISPILQQAITLYENKEFPQAESLCHRILQGEPDDAGAIHLLGLLTLNNGNVQKSVQLIEQAIQINPNDPSFFNNLAVILINDNQLNNALIACHEALALERSHHVVIANLAKILDKMGQAEMAKDAFIYSSGLANNQTIEVASLSGFWNNQGLILEKIGQQNLALSCLEFAVQTDSNNTVAQNNLITLRKNSNTDHGKQKDNFVQIPEAIQIALQHHQAGRLQEAESIYQKILQTSPDHPEALHFLGLIAHQVNKNDIAIKLIDRAINAKNHDPLFFCNKGFIHKELGELDRAIGSYKRALVLNPNYAEVYFNLGVALNLQNKLVEAEAAYRQALTIQPDFTSANKGLASLLLRENRLTEAEETFRKVLEVRPGDADAFCGLGTFFTKTNQLKSAEEAYSRAIDSDPNHVTARWNLCMLRLPMGQYLEAWPDYELRYHLNKQEERSNMPSLPCPQWNGEPLEGKSLIICPEQGFGDSIQFARYAPMLKARGVRHLTVACHQCLKPLFETLSGVDAIVSSNEELTVHDYWVFALSLPLHFGTTLETIPSVPYLSVSAAKLEQWRSRLSGNGLKVGLVWKGSPGHGNDANRSLLGLASLAPLWKIPEIIFFSLQKDAGQDDVGLAAVEQPIVSLGKDILDFADTAAIVAQLDLVICVDTAVAHVAGALGKSCWVLVPAVNTDWRWLRERSDSPWYPNVMRLFRQSTPGDWNEAIDEVKIALQDLVSYPKQA
ncbi:tetratricopeptide (TPR) repeat protein [Oxalobacteraceae bacterium GrIS 1.18]